MSTLVGRKGEVIIEEHIRDSLGIAPGWRAIQTLEGDALVIHFRPPRHRRSLYGALADKAKCTFPDEQELRTAIEESWCEGFRT